MTVNTKCSNCGGFLEYSPKDEALKCVNCGSIEKIENNNPIIQHDYMENRDKFDNSWAMDIRQVKCKECGAQLILNKLDIINKCSYCGSAGFENIKEKALISPDAVIPFKIDKMEAKTHFAQGIKKKWFIPNALKKKIPDVDIGSSYISSFIFNGSANVEYKGVLTYSDTERDRNGRSRTVTRTKHVKGSFVHELNNHVIECSDNLTQKEIEGILPYDTNSQKGYSGEYLLGSTAEYSDKSLLNANNDLEAQVRAIVTKRILSKHNCDGVRTLDLSINYVDKKYVYSLLPTYMVDYDYNKKHYNTLMNGQTGKVGSNVPRSPLKITLFVLFIILLVGGFFGLIYSLM